jgi:hypothetical protein
VDCCPDRGLSQSLQANVAIVPLTSVFVTYYSSQSCYHSTYTMSNVSDKRSNKQQIHTRLYSDVDSKVQGVENCEVISVPAKIQRSR